MQKQGVNQIVIVVLLKKAKVINQGANGPLLCSAPARKWRAIPGHPGSPAITNQEKSDPPGHPGLERVVQSISPNVSILISSGMAIGEPTTSLL